MEILVSRQPSDIWLIWLIDWCVRYLLVEIKKSIAQRSAVSISWWRHPIETFSALLAICAGNSPVNSPHKGQWRGALMFSLICVWIYWLKHSWGWWFETPSRQLWRHCNVISPSFQYRGSHYEDRTAYVHYRWTHLFYICVSPACVIIGLNKRCVVA